MNDNTKAVVLALLNYVAAGTLLGGWAFFAYTGKTEVGGLITFATTALAAITAHTAGRNASADIQSAQAPVQNAPAAPAPKAVEPVIVAQDVAPIAPGQTTQPFFGK